MIPFEDKRISLRVPFISDHMVIYVKGKEDLFSRYVEKEKDRITERVNDAGYFFVFLPDIVSHISPEMMSYMFPGEGRLDVESMYQVMRSSAGLGDKTGFLLSDGGVVFRTFNEECGRDIKEAIDEFIESLGGVRNDVVEDQDRGEDEFDFDLLEPETICASAPFELEFSVHRDEPELDARAQAIIDAWEKLAIEYGVSIEDVAALLGHKVKLSRINIDTAGRIMLVDYDGREVKMDDLSKSVYFFYLKHPEGARLKELQEHEPEILRIYMSITGRDNMEEIRKSVHNLLDPFENNLNVSMSRIKKAFKDIVGERVAQYYYIDGRYGEVRTVRLDRDLVIWNR